MRTIVSQAEIELPEVARQESIVLDARATAIVVVDMQNDFAHPEGTLFTPEAQAVVPVIADLTDRARSAGSRVVYTQDWHDEDDPEFAIWGEHARVDSWGAELVEGLRPDDEDVRIRKLRYDAFYGTSLDHLLRQWQVRDLVVVGTVANICVLHTAGSAALRYYGVVAPDDGIAALTQFDKLSALRQVDFLYRGRITRAAAIEFQSGS